MIEFHTWTTPNGRKPAIMLEEIGLLYSVQPIHIGRDEQYAPDFLKISPNSKIPAIVDPEGPDAEPISVFESGAILIYLAEKTGRLLPSDPRGRTRTMEWLMFQMASIGPMLGQAGHFIRFAPEKVPYGIKRYTDETLRLLGVMDRRLAEAPFLAGDYSNADIATYPWILATKPMEIDLTPFANVQRWLNEIGARPAVIKGMDVP